MQYTAASMLGFTVPLFILLGIEATLALLLLGPRSLAAPALLACRATRTSVSQLAAALAFAATNSAASGKSKSGGIQKQEANTSFVIAAVFQQAFPSHSTACAGCCSMRHVQRRCSGFNRWRQTSLANMHVQAGKTVMNTISGFLAVSLASPVYDLLFIKRASQRGDASASLRWDRKCVLVPMRCRQLKDCLAAAGCDATWLRLYVATSLPNERHLQPWCHRCS